MNATEECAFEVRLWSIVVSIAEFKKVLEHAGSGSAGGHELRDVVSLGFVGFPGFYEGLTLAVGWGDDAVSDSSCGAQFEVWESFAELAQLVFDLLFADAFLGKLFFVFCGKHSVLLGLKFINFEPKVVKNVQM